MRSSIYIFIERRFRYSLLTDKEVLWLKTRELSGLKSAASSANQGIKQKVGEKNVIFAELIRQPGEKQATQCRQAAVDQLKVTQGVLCDTSNTPLLRQQNVRKQQGLPQDYTHQTDTRTHTHPRLYPPGTSSKESLTRCRTSSKESLTRCRKARW